MHIKDMVGDGVKLLHQVELLIFCETFGTLRCQTCNLFFSDEQN